MNLDLLRDDLKMFSNTTANEYNMTRCGYFYPSCNGKTGFFEIECHVIPFLW